MSNMRLRSVSAALTVVLAFWAGRTPAAEPIPLQGAWRFQLDREDVGIDQRWFTRGLEQQIELPGVLQAQGFGDEVTVETKWTGGIVDRSWFTAPEYEKYRQPGHVKVPFWLQPEKAYTGAAWYQRDVELPAGWKGQFVVLSLERPHWETRVWLDDRPCGTQDALATPHEFDLGVVEPGRHRLTVRVDNRLVVDVGHDSHSVSDHTQGNWNGIVGRMELRAKPPVWIDHQRIFPANDGSVAIKLLLRNTFGTPVSGTIAALIREQDTGKVVGTLGKKFEIPTGSNVAGAQPAEIIYHYYPLEITGKLAAPPRLWSEFTPAVYEVETKLALDGQPASDTATTSFGFREIGTAGTQFLLNGQKVFFRGTLECCIFPKTGHPPTDVDAWKRIVRIAKAHGLNNIRFHSWCPPEAAFIAADELGFYYQVECSSWANSTTGLGDGKPIDKWIYEEADRILKCYGNHPSFLLLTYGNEPGGKYVPFLKKWVEHYKAQDGRRLYTSASGWPQIPENQFHVTPDPRVQAWGGGLKSRINAKPPETHADYREYIAARQVPVISHEIGQWCVYPNFAEIPKYTGYLKPKNFDIFRDSLDAHHLGDLAQTFLLASGKLQTLCYKEDIESALRTPGMGGFQLLDLHDFPGQGTALVGVLDPFWESKGYVTAAEYSRFCNSTVPLARLDKRVFTADESLAADVEVAHFGPAPLEATRTAWKLVGHDGQAVARGQLPAQTIPVGNAIALGSVRIALKDIPAPACYKLVVGLEGTEFENDWDVWVYPPQVDTQTPQGVTVVDDLNAEAQAALDAGGKVLLLIPPRNVRGDKLGRVAIGFSSIFWNTAWTHRQPPHTLGILCDPQHPALADFPTEFCSNWQWWYLVSRAGAMLLDDLPPQLRPTVQVIDDWVTARRLGLVFEAKLGKGRLLVCSLDLRRDLDVNPVARQMLHSLLHYMAGERFQPELQVTAAQIRGLMAPPSALRRLGAKVLRVDSEDRATGNVAAQAIDGDPATIWHTKWDPAPDPMPHEFVLDLGREAILKGLTYLPRQEMSNGRIAECEIYCTSAADNWGTAAATVQWPNTDQLQTVLFPAAVKARMVRLVIKSEVKHNPFAAIAELDVIVDGL